MYKTTDQPNPGSRDPRVQNHDTRRIAEKDGEQLFLPEKSGRHKRHRKHKPSQLRRMEKHGSHRKHHQHRNHSVEEQVTLKGLTRDPMEKVFHSETQKSIARRADTIITRHQPEKESHHTDVFMAPFREDHSVACRDARSDGPGISDAFDSAPLKGDVEQGGIRFGNERSGSTAAFNGYCPQCKLQLMWTRKKFNTGIRTFYNTCPNCLPPKLKRMSLTEAVLQVESVQRNLEALTSSVLSKSRDISRIQTELQFIMIDIEENASTSDLDTTNYEHLVGKLAKSLDENVDLIIDCTRDKPPTLLERVKELCADMAEQLERQKEGDKESAYIYALFDVLKQLELFIYDVDIETSLREEDCKEFRDEVDTLRQNLENTKYVLKDMPLVSELPHDLDRLNDRYLSLIKEADRKHSQYEQREVLRRKLEEMERQREEMERKHAAEVEALQTQLDTFMSTTVAAAVIAVDSVTCAEDTGNDSQEVDNSSASCVAEAEVVGAMVIDRHLSTRTVEAELLHPASTNSETCALENAGRPDNVPETVPTNRPSSTPIAEADFVTADHTTTRLSASQNSETQTLGNLRRLNDVSEILHVLEEHPTSALVQATALEKLGNLTHDKKTNAREMDLSLNGKLEENRRKIGNAGGIDLILKAEAVS